MRDVALIYLRIRYLQLDAWWYKQKGSMPPDGPWFPGCIQEWVGNSTLFPSGKGAAPLWAGGSRGGLPLHLYHSYFCPSPDNNYPTYDWVRSDPAPKNHSFAHVHSSQALRFYTALLAKAKARDGMIGWEVDFLVDQYHRFGGFRRDVSTADEYFGSMAAAAAEQKVGLQHCMSIPRFALASLDYPYVTNARASDDYATASPLEYNAGKSISIIVVLAVA